MKNNLCLDTQLNKKKKGHSKWAFILVFGLPAFLLYVFICIVPMFTSLFYGFFDVNSYDISNKVLVWLQNYGEIFSDPLFWKAVGNDFLIILGKEVLIISFALFFAVAMTKFGLKNKEVGVYRFLLYIPNVLSVVFIATFWQNFFRPNGGLFSIIFNNNQVDWMAEYPLQIVTFIASWCGVGHFMIILISAINAIPKSLYESARIDGANQWQQLWSITIPQVKNQIVFLAVNIVSSSLAGNMNLVLPLYGNSNDSIVMGTYVYYYAQTCNELGYSNAAAVILMIISFVVCFSLNKAMTRKED